MSSSSDSRTDRSSSTTNTVPVTSAMEMTSAPRDAVDGLIVYGLPSPERGFDGFDQRGVAEGLEQTCHRAGRDEARLNRSVAVPGDEHDRDSFAAASQFVLEIRSAQPRQR